jgi:hypothetical protein
LISLYIYIYIYIYIGEAVNEEKENVVKEAELKTAIDAKVSSPTSEEKNQNAEEV